MHPMITLVRSLSSGPLARVVTSLSAMALAAVISAAPLAAQSPDAAYERVAKAWGGTRTLEATFTQQITNPVLGRTVSSKGLFRQARPGKVAITFTEPAGDRIVGDGQSLWVYLPSSTPGQVLKLPADADGAIVADLLGALLEAPRRSFTISGGDDVTIDGRATTRVQLAPKQAGAFPFQKAVLWLDAKEPRPVRVQVIDAQGVDRTITLTTWSPEATLPADAFTFRVPKGAKVSTNLPGL